MSITGQFFRFGRKTCLILMLGGLLQACVSAPPQIDVSQNPLPVVHYPEFGEKPEFVSHNEIFQLTPKQEASFVKFLKAPNNNDVLRHKVVADYLHRFIKGFNYHSETFIASESADFKEGNCLSLAILTTAIARIAEVDVGYELMHSTPVFERMGNTILSSEHIRSVLHQPLTQEQLSYELIFQPIIRIDYFPIDSGHIKRKVLETEFVSMYFRNKSAEAIIEKRYDDAFWLAMESLDYAPGNPHTINILALIYERVGYKDDAENIYNYGIKHSSEKLDLLTNYRNFLVAEERGDEAKAIELQIARLEDQNPFDWLELAEEHLAKGNLNNAEKYFQKMIDAAPYLHHGYFGLSKVAFARGHPNTSRKQLDKALERTFEPETRSLYEAKLSALIGYSTK